MGPTRTMAFQMPEDMFQRLKDYLRRHNITQKEFVLGLVETELNRDQELRNAQTADTVEPEDDEELDEEDLEDEDFDEDEDESEELDDDESEDEGFDEDEDESEELDEEESEDETYTMAM